MSKGKGINGVVAGPSDLAEPWRLNKAELLGLVTASRAMDQARAQMAEAQDQLNALLTDLGIPLGQPFHVSPEGVLSFDTPGFPPAGMDA